MVKSNLRSFRNDQSCLSVADINAESIPSLGGTLLFSGAFVQWALSTPWHKPEK